MAAHLLGRLSVYCNAWQIVAWANIPSVAVEAPGSVPALSEIAWSISSPDICEVVEHWLNRKIQSLSGGLYGSCRGHMSGYGCAVLYSD